jgi:hypothetical protein
MSFLGSVAELMIFSGAVLLVAALLLELSKPSQAMRMKSGRSSTRVRGPFHVKHRSSGIVR